MSESPKGSIFSSLRALEEVLEETPTAIPTPQNVSPAPVQAAPPPPTPTPMSSTPPVDSSSEALKSVEAKIEKIDQKIQELGNLPISPNLDRIEALEKNLQQMQERAIQAEVALREREKSQEAARRETESLLQNLASQRRLEESDRQMKENLSYCRHRIEELEERQASLKISDTQQSEHEFKSLLKNFMEQIDLKTAPILTSLLELKKENQNREKESLNMEKRIGHLETKTANKSQVDALREDFLHLKQSVEKINLETSEKLDKITAALSLLSLKLHKDKATEELIILDKEFQKIHSILNANISNSPKQTGIAPD